MGELGDVYPLTCTAYNPEACSGQEYGQGGGGYSYDWWSNNTSIAPVYGSSTGSSANFYGQNIGTATATGEVLSEYCSGQSSGTNNVTSCSLSVGSPANGQVFSTSGGNANQATMSLNAMSNCSGTASWSFGWTYTTGNGTPYSSSATTQTTVNQNTTYLPPVGNGGSGSISVSTPQASATSQFYIDGTSIPSSSITAQLVALYGSGNRPHLLTGIAEVESSYHPFINVLKYGVQGYWPNESYDGGSHVGLMQVPMSMANAFDWTADMRAGMSVFNWALGVAQRWSDSETSAHPGLPALTPTQIENDALIFYGPYGSAGHYYVPDSSGTSWIANPNNSNGVNYANQCVASMQ